MQRWIDIIGKDTLIKKIKTSNLEDALELMIRKSNSNTAVNYLNRLNKMFRYAVQRGYLETNPCAPIEVIKNPNEKRNEMKFWTLHQVTTPKTNNSYRTITIPSFLCQLYDWQYGKRRKL